MNENQAATDAVNAHAECVMELNRVMAERDALAAKVEHLRKALEKISPVKLVWLAQWCDQVDDDRAYTGKREVQTDLREWATVIQEALSDAPPPAVVPAADVEPLLEAIRTVGALCNVGALRVRPLDVAIIVQDKLGEALSAYRTKHPAR